MSNDESEEYEMLRDRIIDLLNPPDDDIAEMAIMLSAVERVAAYVESRPCTCTTAAADYDDDPCARCEVLGRVADESVPR